MIVDLFAGGLGGWDVALGLLDRTDVVGFEWDAVACDTRRAAGHKTIRADVAAYPVEHLRGKVEGLIASPPCPDFSAAGRRKGVNGTSGHLIFEVPRWVLGVRPTWVACEQVPEVLPYWQRFADEFQAEGYHCWAGVLCAADYGVPQERYRAVLMAHSERAVLPPPRTHMEHPHPDLFGETLPKWVSMADGLGWGMTERPMITMRASGTSPGGGSGARAAIERERERVQVVGYRRRRGEGMTARYGERPDTPADRPAPTLTSKARSDELIVTDRPTDRVCLSAGCHDSYNGTLRPVDRPAPTLAFGHNAAGWGWVVNTRQRSRTTAGPGAEDYKRTVERPSPTLTAQSGGFWQWEQPATTVCGDPRITARCHHDEGTQGANPKTTEQVQEGDYEGTEPIKLTVVEALILQDFPPDYPVQGSRTKAFEQIGNAIPVRLARAVLAQLLD